MAAEIEADIKAGRLKPGDKLPSIKEQQRLGVGETTAKRVYTHLQGLGLITSSHGLGYFVATASPGSPSLEERVAALESDVADIKGRLDR